MTLVQEHRNADLNPVMVVVTRLGDFRTQFIAGALLGGILLLTRQWRPAIFAIGTLVGTALANQTLKTLFARARPEVLAEPLSSFSFPADTARRPSPSSSPWASSPAASNRRAGA